MREWKNDLFTHTQNRLTVRYSLLIMIFLALFIAIVSFIVDVAITFEQERQLQSITDQEVNLIEETIGDKEVTQEELDNLSMIRENGNQFFYYVVNPDGEFMFGDEFIDRLRPDILKLLGGWVPKNQEVRYGTMLLPPPPPHGHPHQPLREDREIHLLMTGRAIYQGDHLAAIFYTGRDITFTYELTHRLLTILIQLGVLFFGIALFLSYFMSKRAMIPIRQSFERQKKFVADASHELRTPLSILHSSIDVLEMEEGENLSVYSRNVMSNMKDEVRRMTRLVGDLLTLARTGSGSPELHSETFDLIPAVEQLVSSTQTLAESKDIELTLHAPSTLMFYGDRERIKQLLYILLDNAMKYMPGKGEVHLSLSLESQDKQSSLCIAVRDTGVGIPAEEQQRIFDRFYRVDKNRSRQMGGTGLGLAIAKWIVDAHHGTIKVASKVGKGSTFTVRLPVQPPNKQ